jgi:addiction module HigA family antidote
MQETKLQHKLRPTHPGAILRNMLAELADEGTGQFAALTQKELAKRLGVSPRAITDLIHGRREMTADMAIRLSRVFKTTPDIWMNLQKALDLWDALGRIGINTRSSDQSRHKNAACTQVPSNEI